MNIRRSEERNRAISTTSLFPFDLNSRKIVLQIIAFLLTAWLLMSTIFLIPIVRDPAIAIRGDDYWAFSQWFGTDGPYPHTHFGPLFPLFLRLLREMGVSIVGAIVIQKLLVLFSGFLVYRIGRSSGLGPGTAAVAGGIYTAYPIVQAQSNLLFAETFYLSLLLSGIVVLMSALIEGREVKLSSLAGGFLLLGLAALARGNGLILFAGLGISALFMCPWRKVLLAGFIGAMPVLIWSGFNYQWYGHFKPTSSGDANVAASVVGPVYSRLEGKPRISGPEVWIEGKWQDLYSNPFDYSSAVRAMAIDYALEHPLAVLVGNVRGWLRSLTGPAHRDYLEFFGAAGNLFSIVSFAIRSILLFGIGLFVASGAWRLSTTFTIVLALMLLGHILTAGAAGFARFGFPIDSITTVALLLAIRTYFEKRLTKCSSPIGTGS